MRFRLVLYGGFERWLRRFIPLISGIDLSPLVAILLLQAPLHLRQHGVGQPDDQDGIVNGFDRAFKQGIQHGFDMP